MSGWAQRDAERKEDYHEWAAQESIKYRKEIVKYRKALLAIVNGECINPQEFAREVLNRDI